MRKIRSLIGMPVIVGKRRAGRVIQAELSEDLTEMTGIWIDAGLKGTRFLPAESLGMLGTVAVMADSIGKRRRMKSHTLLRRAVGTDGTRLGAITGAEINELSFRVETLELSCGLWDDLLYGRKRIHRYTLNRENGDVIVYAAETEKEDGNHEERNDEGSDYRSADRRFGSGNVRRDELADGQKDEPADEKDRPLAYHEG